MTDWAPRRPHHAEMAHDAVALIQAALSHRMPAERLVVAMRALHTLYPVLYQSGKISDTTWASEADILEAWLNARREREESSQATATATPSALES